MIGTNGNVVSHNTAPNAQDNGTSAIITRLRDNPCIDVDSALAVMSGMEDLYVGTIALTARLMAERLAKMDRYIINDMNAFMIEVHGLRSVLRNIGSFPLEGKAGELEAASAQGDAVFCVKNYPAFKMGLTVLAYDLRAALAPA
jgi:hypothetical protein